MFPVINTIEDVLPHIEGHPNFYVNKKSDYFVIDYILNTPDMFNDPFQKECRGILFYEDGRIMSRRLHKFFNVNEREETRIENLDLSKPHVILEKLDGSMITAMFSNGKMTWGSKAGVTFLTPQIEEFVKNNPNYNGFAANCMDSGWTPIFEWCSRQNRIVIDHPEDRLVLLAVRNNITGEYSDYDTMLTEAFYWTIDCVKQFEGNVRNMQQLSDSIKDMSGIEGFVVRFDDGTWCKIKCDEYCMYHKAKEDINNEKNVVSILVDHQADDFKNLLQKQDRINFEKFEADFWVCFHEFYEIIYDVILNIHEQNLSRKDFALNTKSGNPYVRAITFSLFDKKDVSESDIKHEMLKIIKKNCGSQTNIDKVRSIWGNLKWDDYKYSNITEEQNNV